MFGTAENSVQRMDAIRDGVTLGLQGKDIEFSMLMNYSNLGSPAQYKRGELCRPTFVGEIAPEYNLALYYDYAIKEAILPSGFTQDEAYYWDEGFFDSATWTLTQYASTFSVIGGEGIGRAIAPAIVGKITTGTVLVSVDLMWRAGGVL